MKFDTFIELFQKIRIFYDREGNLKIYFLKTQKPLVILCISYETNTTENQTVHLAATFSEREG